jgi:hypothetical protein
MHNEVMSIAELYDRDTAEWARQNAELLREGRFSEADIEHIAEEIEDMSKRERHSLRSRLTRLIEHLLNWQYQPERRGASWEKTIVVQRRGIEVVLEESPSLKPSLPETAAKAYQDAVLYASRAIKRSPLEFPRACPYTIEQLLDYDFLP